jgi:hypothetical protein
LEEAMIKSFAICAALVALGTGSLAAQERQATQPDQMQGREHLTRVEVPGTDFDLIIAETIASGGAAIDGNVQSDPLDAGLWPTEVYFVPKGHVLASPRD